MDLQNLELLEAIIGTDDFLDRGRDEQLLYIYLFLKADRNGQIHNPRAIARMLNCSDAYYNLIDKELLEEMPDNQGCYVTCLGEG